MNIYSFMILMLCVCSSSVPGAGAQDGLNGRALVEALRQGGYNIYFRHATTDWSRDDHVINEGDWTSCDPERMRQLSDHGRVVAHRIGEAIRRLGIPIGRVFSSEYCRTQETAQEMNLGPVRPTRAVMNMRAASFLGGSEAVIRRAQQAISEHPPSGKNNVFVAHGNLMRAISGAYTVEAGAVIFFPQGNGDFQLVAQVEPEQWEILAKIIVEGMR